MEKYVLINSENRFPRTCEISKDGVATSLVFTKREGKEFTSRLDETEIFDHQYDDPRAKREFYSLIFKTELEIFSF